MNRYRHFAQGFTLTELAMVLMIIGLLLGGMLMPISAQQDIRGRQETDRALNTMREALIGFAAINGRLPCPAQPSVPSGISGAGNEATTGTGTSLSCACSGPTSDVSRLGGLACADTSVTGAFPWATLGLSEIDAWGQRFTYRVSTSFARGVPQSSFGCSPGTTPTSSAFALCSVGDISVKSAASGGADIATNVPAIIVSHGRSSAGAYSTTGTQIGYSSASADEQENANGDKTYVSGTGLDDQVAWISVNVLMNRMISAGKLP